MSTGSIVHRLEAVSHKEDTVLRLLVLAGVAAGAYFAWKKLTSTSEESELEENMYGSARMHQAEQNAGTGA